jgi:hypothetical protein
LRETTIQFAQQCSRIQLEVAGVGAQKAALLRRRRQYLEALGFKGFEVLQANMRSLGSLVEADILRFTRLAEI